MDVQMRKGANMYAKVYVEITNICNMSCSFCHGHSRTLGRMTREQFAQVLERLQGKTHHIYYHLMGEPLSHPQLPEFIGMAREQGLRSIITTNGTLLARRGQELIQAGPHKVSISLHSFEGELGGTAGQDEAAYERYMTQVADFADQASQAGIIVVLRLWNRGHDGGRNDRTFEYLRSRLEGQWVENTRGIRIRDKLHLEWGDRFAWPDLAAEVQGEEVSCWGLKDHFGILCDGTVVPCCLDSNGVIALGNIFEEDIEVILGSPRARAMVEGFACRQASEELCRRCGYAQRFV
jgi:MoaA/NifB/PqqE/SkfB family radical SAM enzyme